MLFKLLFTALLAIVSPIISFVFPFLPDAFASIFLTLIRYLQSGVNFIFLFIDWTLVSQFFVFWIEFKTLMMAVELIIHVVRLITGNAGGEDAET